MIVVFLFFFSLHTKFYLNKPLSGAFPFQIVKSFSGLTPPSLTWFTFVQIWNPIKIVKMSDNTQLDLLENSCLEIDLIMLKKFKTKLISKQNEFRALFSNILDT